MMQAGLTREGNRIELSGDLTVQTVRSLFDRTPRFPPGEMSVALETVREVDSAGLALLVRWSNLAGLSTRLTFTGAPPELQQMSKITGLE